MRNVLATTAVLVLLGAAMTAAAPQGHDPMPAPARLQWREGKGLPVDATFGFRPAGPADVRVASALERMATWLQGSARLRKPPAIDPRAGALVVEWTAAGRPVQAVDEDESYVLEIDARGGR